jgi:hypothetical protein
MDALLPVSLLFQPVVYQGHEYYTSQYFHREYVANGVYGKEYKEYDYFLKSIRSIAAYTGYLTTKDIVGMLPVSMGND